MLHSMTQHRMHHRTPPALRGSDRGRELSQRIDTHVRCSAESALGRKARNGARSPSGEHGKRRVRHFRLLFFVCPECLLDLCFSFFRPLLSFLFFLFFLRFFFLSLFSVNTHARIVLFSLSSL